MKKTSKIKKTEEVFKNERPQEICENCGALHFTFNQPCRISDLIAKEKVDEIRNYVLVTLPEFVAEFTKDGEKYPDVWKFYFWLKKKWLNRKIGI